MLRRTKIVATLGPATDQAGVLENLIQQGLDVVRINCSHGDAQDRIRRVEMVRELSKKFANNVAILFDLQGPKIRISRFKNKQITLVAGEEFILDPNLDENAGDIKQVSVDYKNLAQDVVAQDILLLDDGRIVLKVTSVAEGKIYTQVEQGGILSNNKGINKQNGGLTADALTDKDREDILLAAKLDVDYVAVSFPRNAADIKLARKLLQEAGSSADIVSKIERVEAIDVIDEIIQESNAVMVARGDLGVEIGDARLPAVQKMIIKHARKLNKPVIIATQMMETMITNSIPTRAEVFDVANAVLDGTDAVMLSAETATGDHPAKVVEAMIRVCCGAEQNTPNDGVNLSANALLYSTDEAIAMAAMYAANRAQVKAIVAFTETGATVRYMSRISSSIPIYGFSRHHATCNKMKLYRGVYPVEFDSTHILRDKVYFSVIEYLCNHKIVSTDDLVLVTLGYPLGVAGVTNTMKLLRVSEVLNEAKNGTN